MGRGLSLSKGPEGGPSTGSGTALPLAVVTLEPTIDQDGAIVDFEYVWANAAACDYNGMSRQRMVGLRLLELFPGLATTGTFEQYVAVMRTGTSLLLEDFIYDNELRGNEPLRYDVRLARAGGGLVVSWQDVTDRFLTTQDLARHATTDSLTQLTSREEGQAMLRRALQASALERGVAVAYLDVDGLKEVNDRHGHAAGDALLVATAKRIRAAVRGDDAVVRMGGDEIVVVLQAVGHIEAALSACEKIREAVAAPVGGDPRLAASLSIGLTMADRDDTVESILHRADQAMYQAKREGGNRVHVA